VASWLGNSLGRQLEAARKYAADRDLTLDASMRHEGLSGAAAPVFWTVG
jgi:hypothetical protein